MSSVNSYDGYLIKHLSDYEDELKNDSKRAQERARDEVDRMSRNYEEATRRHEDKLADTLERSRNDLQEQYDRSRESDRAELERIQRTHYDRFGRDRSNEADILRQQLDASTRNSEAEHDSHQQQVHDLEMSTSKRVEDLHRQYDDHYDRVLQAERQSGQSTLDGLNEKHRNALDTQREEYQRKYEDLARARMTEQQDNRHRAETIVEDAKRDMDNLKSHAEDSAQERITKASEAELRRLEQNSRVSHDAHEEETGKLRDQIRDIVSSGGDYVKGRAEGRVDAVRDYENETRTRLREAENAHQAEIDKLRAGNDEAAKSTAHASELHARDRDNYYAGLIARQAKENREDHTATVDRYETAYKEMEQRNARDRQYSDDRLENALRSANEERENALVAQAESFKKSIAAQRELDQDSIDGLQKQLEKKRNPTDASDISPAVENAVRRSIVRQYEKNLAAEAERNKASIDSLQRDYADRLQTTLDEHQIQMTGRELQHQSEQHQAEVRFVEHIQDTEAQKEQTLRLAQADHDRETETMNRVFNQATMRQRGDYETMIQDLRNDASNRIQAQRQEAEFAMKTQQRAFSVRENELVRSYEKKLAEQKLDFETRIDDIRTQTQQTIHENERREKQNYEDQTRSYEQRIAQMEEKHAERERNLTQNYQDELDKVRRSNALIQSKKG